MDRTTDLREHANCAPSVETQTFMGSIRWVALAIGLGCLALLSLIAGVAHAGTAAAVARTISVAQPGEAWAARGSPPPEWRIAAERRKPSDR